MIKKNQNNTFLKLKEKIASINYELMEKKLFPKKKHIEKFNFLNIYIGKTLTRTRTL